MIKQLSFKHRVHKDYVSVIIPVFVDYIGLSDTLKSLDKQNFPTSKYEVIVINDGGDKKISKIIAKHKHKEIKITPNRGSYYARNKGLELSKGEYIAFTDADAIVQDNWLEKGCSLIKKNGYVGGKISIDKSKVKTIPTLYDYFTAFHVDEYMKGEHFAPTANLFVKKYIFEELGGFDESLSSGGDLEFGNRVFINKFKQCYSEELKVIHPPRSFFEILKKIERVTKGHKDLIRSYPKRFQYRNWSKLTIIKASLNPQRFYYDDQSFITNAQLYVLSWFIKIYDTYIKIFKYK